MILALVDDRNSQVKDRALNIQKKDHSKESISNVFEESLCDFILLMSRGDLLLLTFESFLEVFLSLFLFLFLLAFLIVNFVFISDQIFLQVYLIELLAHRHMNPLEQEEKSQANDIDQDEVVEI